MTGQPDRTALYRIRGEAETLLYIGITNGIPFRWNGHQAVQPWWDELRSLTVEWHETRDEAEAAEKAAIRAEQPKYNVTHLRGGRRRRQKQPTVRPAGYENAALARRDLLAVPEVAQRFRCSPRMVRRLADAGEVERVKLGALVRITPESVVAYKNRLRAEARDAV